MSGENKIEDDNTEKPWDKKKTHNIICKEDVSGFVDITLANQIYIKNNNIKPRALNCFRRLVAFSNPEFYKTQAMGFSTKGIPRIVQCSSDTNEYVCLPRGCEEKLLGLLKESDVPYKITDRRQFGRKINVEFIGELYPEQKNAAEKMLSYNYGILGAATGFGKTIIGAYLIAELKVNTLILVHNREIMKNWINDFDKFLKINEELPNVETRRGKKGSIVGRLYSGHNSMNGIIDVAMISSLGKGDEINQSIKDYGLVIMDECHHVGAQTYENILKEVNAKFVYGLTATPKREDGQEQKIFMQFGPIRYRLIAKDRAKTQSFSHYVYPRFTRMVNSSGEKWGINDAYKAIILDEKRNQLIIDDVLECIANGRTPLVLTKFKEHAETLVSLLEEKVKHIFLLQGGRSTKERDRITDELNRVSSNEPVVLVAIGKYIGEGFNYPRLDTMMLAVPIAWQGNVEQYSGRLHRDYEGKEDVVIYDYVDTHIKVLEGMYHKRLKAYKKIGYEICLNLNKEKQNTNSIFDIESYKLIYEKDLKSAHTEVIISSPGVNETKIKRTLKLLAEPQLTGVKVSVITLPAEDYPESRIEITKKLHKDLQDSGIYLKTVSGMHEHFVVVDKEVVWYGSMNFLSREKEDDNLMRLQNKEIAAELLEISFY